VDGSEDLITLGFADAAILDEQVLGVLGEVKGHEDTEGGCTVDLKGSRVFLRISEPSEVGTVELDVFCRNGERVVLRGLDFRDDVEWRSSLSVRGWTAKDASQVLFS